MASQSESVHCVIVGCNSILVLLGLEMGDKDVVVVEMVGVQDVLNSNARLHGEAPSVIRVELLHQFSPHVHFV